MDATADGIRRSHLTAGRSIHRIDLGRSRFLFGEGDQWHCRHGYRSQRGRRRGRPSIAVPTRVSKDRN